MPDNQEKKVGKSGFPYLFLNILLSTIIIFLIGKYFFQNASMFGDKLIMPSQSQAMTPAENLPTNTSVSTAKRNLTPTATIVPLCNSDRAVVYFLSIAKDLESNNNEQVNPEDYQVGFADGIRIIRVDFRDASISMLAIPRDLMVTVPNLQSKGIYEARLKIVYAYGNEYDVPGGGASQVAQTLNTNFGFHIDHYVVLNYSSFALGIDSIGGIDVVIPDSIGKYTPGVSHMDGREALAYARLRTHAGENTSDAARRERQTQVLFAIQEKVFSKEIIPKIPEIVSHMLQALKTDLTNKQLGQYICLAEKISSVEYQELNPNYYLRETDSLGNERLIPDYFAIREFVQEFQSP